MTKKSERYPCGSNSFYLSLSLFESCCALHGLHKFKTGDYMKYLQNVSRSVYKYIEMTLSDAGIVNEKIDFKDSEMTTLKHNCWRRVKWVDFVFFFLKFSLCLTLFVNKPIENSVCLKNLFAQNSYHWILFKINALISVQIYIFNAQIWGYVRISGCVRSQLLFACKKAVKTHKAYLSSFIFSIFKNLLCKSLCFQYNGGEREPMT